MADALVPILDTWKRAVLVMDEVILLFDAFSVLSPLRILTYW